MRLYSQKRFDSILAMIRTYDYINSKESDEIILIANTFLNQSISENYLSNPSSCIRYSKNDDERYTLSQIEQIYPGLNSQMSSIMRNYEGEGLRAPITC